MRTYTAEQMHVMGELHTKVKQVKFLHLMVVPRTKSSRKKLAQASPIIFLDWKQIGVLNVDRIVTETLDSLMKKKRDEISKMSWEQSHGVRRRYKVETMLSQSSAKHKQSPSLSRSLSSKSWITKATRF